MRSRGGGGCADCRFKRAMLDNQCYRSVPSMLLPSNIASNPLQESVMHSRFPLAPLLALVLAACSPSNGSEKKGGHPGMGMPPPEVLTTTVAAQSLPLGFEYAGQTAGSPEVELRAPVPRLIPKRNVTEGAPVEEGQSPYT